jgi:hypothetical protein
LRRHHQRLRLPQIETRTKGHAGSRISNFVNDQLRMARKMHITKFFSTSFPTGRDVY